MKVRKTPFFKNLDDVQEYTKDWPYWKKHSLGKVVKRPINSCDEESII